jgi:glycosyltransferase involved in cell wall biosynthesis
MNSRLSAASMTGGPGVLLVGNFLQATLGTVGVCEELAEQLAGAGWTVVTTSDRPSRWARLADMLHTAWTRRREYEVAQVDVYSGPAFVWAEAVCLLLRLAARPYVLTLHGGALPAFAGRWPRRVRHLLSGATAVTTPSKYLAEQLSGFSRPRLIPNAMRLERYPFRRRTAPRPQLVWLRAFHDIYNPSLAPRVVAALRADFPDVRLIMAGPDKGDGSLARTKAAAAALDVMDRIDFAGPIAKSDVGAWLDRGDIFLNTTRIDNTPVSVIEAMACGLCIVSTDVGGVPYLLDHERTALLVAPDRPAEMAAAVRRLLCDASLAESLSTQARRDAEAMSWRAVLPQWQQLLRDASRPARYSPHTKPTAKVEAQ